MCAACSLKHDFNSLQYNDFKAQKHIYTQAAHPYMLKTKIQELGGFTRWTTMRIKLK